MRLEGKVALVAHADSALGAAVARRFAAEGAQVSVCVVAGGSDGPRGQTADWGNLQLVDGDPRNPGDAERIVEGLSARYGRLDILVNYGAGGRLTGSVTDVSRPDFDTAMVGDVWSLVALSSAAIPLIAKGGGGSIVNLCSIARVGVKGRPLRSPGQAAVAALTRSMALDHAAEGIRVNALLLGPTMGPEFSGPQLERLMKESPLGQLHTTEDVAAAALFLASDEARMITGALIPLDAGRSLPTF